MRILCIGTFDPEYSRTRVIIKGLKDNGHEIVFCNGGLTGGVKKFIRLVWHYLVLSNNNFDLIFVAFPAQEATLVVGVLSWYHRMRHSVPLVVDMLTSHYEGYILNRKKYPQNSLRAHWYRWLDRTAISLADCAIVDSDANAKFFAEEYAIQPAKFLTLLIGTDDAIMKPAPLAADSNNFLVHFHGSFAPHQGIGTIIKAANILKKEHISFQIIGNGQDYALYRKMADDFELSNIIWIPSVPYETLPDHINKAHMCLGPMGGTDHFDRCAPNKIYEYMACGKAIVTGNSKALVGIAYDRSNMLLVEPANEQALAEKILFLKNNPLVAVGLEQNARADFLNLYTPKKLIADFLHSLRQQNQVSATPRPTHVLITGASGFIGSRLSTFLRDRGYVVTAYQGRINDVVALDDVFRCTDVVIHLAAKIDDIKNSSYADFVSVNVGGAQNVIDLCLKYSSKLIFLSSSTAVHPSSPYGLTKSLAEQLIRFYGEHCGLKAVIISPRNVYDDCMMDRFGKHVDLARGRNYPLQYLLADIERIIARNQFSTQVRTHSPRLVFNELSYWPRRIINKLRTIV